MRNRLADNRTSQSIYGWTFRRYCISGKQKGRPR